MKNFSHLITATLFLAAIFGSALSKAADQAGKPVFEVQRIYLKALDLKQPNSPGMFLETEIPKIAVSLKTEPVKINAETFEVSVNISLSAHIKGKLVYSVNAQQAGIFTIKNVPARELPLLLGIGSPNIIYPYLRANVADIITRAGYAPVNLAEINWETHYEQEKKKTK